MSLTSFKKSVQETINSLNKATSNRVSFDETLKSSHLLDYKGIQKEYYRKSFYQSVNMLEKYSISIQELAALDENNARLISEINSCIKKLKQEKKTTRIRELLEDIQHYSEQLREAGSVRVHFNPDSLPDEIRSEIIADVKELGLCFNNGCYRSAIILCGRILETALHRLYYEVTKNDLLEKSPGIGLGNLIAKLKDKGIELDPGLGNQVHLINQLRIYSVHKKQQVFEPSKTQAHAIILYTIDILEKMFK